MGEGAAYVVEWLIALLATVGLGSVAYENRDAIVSSYKEYLEAQIDTEMFIIDSVKDSCVQVYDKASNTIQKISWQTLLDSMQECHDVSVDNLTGLYVKYCPQLLNSFNDYTTEVLSGDVYVSGVSDAIITDTSFNASDLEAQWSDSVFKYTCYAEISFDTSQVSRRTWTYDCFTSVYYPVAGYLDTREDSDGNTSTLLRFQSWKYGSVTMICYSTTIHNGNVICSGNKNMIGTGSASSVNNGVLTFNANFPVFSNYGEAMHYLKTGKDYENALNYGPTFYDSITEDSDLPPFHNKWQQELWERVANTPDIITIGSYGHGVLDDNWGDDIPWIALDYLQEYALSVIDIYQQIVDDIINGTYMSDRGIPKTYSDAWDAAIVDTWSDVVHKSEVADEGEEDEKEDDSYYKKGLVEIPDDWIEVEAPEELEIKSQSFINFLKKQGYNPKNWVKVVEKWASPDGLIYQRNYWTDGTDYFYHGEGIEEFFPH